MFKLIPFWFVAEIAAFWWTAGKIGFWDTMLYWWGPCLIGFIITSSFSRGGLMTLQTSMMAGQVPEKRILHAGMIFLGGVLFWLPFVGTRVLGTLLVLPGTRHLLLWKFQKGLAQRMAEQMAKGAAGGGFQFASFRFGAGPGSSMGGMAGEFRTARGTFSERDVTPNATDVLDVKPIEVTHSSISSKNPHSDSN